MTSTLDTIAVFLLLIASAIAWKQRRASSCPRHRRYVDWIAWGAAVVCLLTAVAVLVLNHVVLPAR